MLKIFTPDFILKSVLSIDEDFLHSNNIRALILDLDNTLSLHGSPLEEAGVTDWLAQMCGLGIGMIIVSNNNFRRVKPLADKLGLPFIANGAKPLPIGISKAVKTLDLPRGEICVVGDQILTDVVAGEFFGLRTILVDPFEIEHGKLMRLKRHIEVKLFKRKLQDWR